MKRGGQNALMMACASPPSNLSQGRPQLRQDRIRCALSLLAATAPIQVADFPDQAVLLQFACQRLLLIEVVLAMMHTIEDAPPLARVNVLKTDAQGVVVMLVRWRSHRLEYDEATPRYR